MKGAIYVSRVCLPLGLVIFIVNQLIDFSDFVKGFFTGMSSILMIIGLVYAIVWLARGKNPYGSLKKRDSEKKKSDR